MKTVAVAINVNTWHIRDDNNHIFVELNGFNFSYLQVTHILSLKHITFSRISVPFQINESMFNFL
jgi:hypothetical protein